MWLETAIGAAPSAEGGHELKYPQTEGGQGIYYALDTDSEKNALNSTKQRGVSMYDVRLSVLLYLGFTAGPRRER